eukprot:4809288-Pyramimonas_sp.AAC.1
MAGFACRSTSISAHPIARFVVPSGAPSKTILTTAAPTTAHGWVLRQASFCDAAGADDDDDDADDDDGDD